MGSKRVFPFALILLLLVGAAAILPTAALAAPAGDYVTLQAVCSAITGDAVVELTGNMINTAAGTTQLTIARSLTLDLNGHALTIALDVTQATILTA